MRAKNSPAASAAPASKKTAEQLAAQALLDLIAVRDQADEVVQVPSDESLRLQSDNPKGRLLEWCARHRITAPHFQQDASPAGYRVRGQLALAAEQAILTPWFDAPKLKLGEQAAAEALLQRLPTVSPPSVLSDSMPRPPATPSPTSENLGRNPAMDIHELCQAGVLQAAGYEVLDPTGPSHQPSFSVVGWATTPARPDHPHRACRGSLQEGGTAPGCRSLVGLAGPGRPVAPVSAQPPADPRKSYPAAPAQRSPAEPLRPATKRATRVPMITHGHLNDLGNGEPAGLHTP